MSDFKDLPDIKDFALPHINNVISNLNLPRNIIASDEEIGYAWRDLPREILRIPVQLRNEFIARMCVATSVGLFDGAINYVWNASILALKQKVRNFGFAYVAQIKNKKFEEKDLNEMMDSNLLDLCYKLDLLSEEGYFFLSQCRDIRNNFSVAHPSIATIDDRELITFISRCCKYALTSDYQLTGIAIPDFIGAIKGKRWDATQLDEWDLRLRNTFQAQRQLLIPMLYGIYCDATSNEQSRVNSIILCTKCKDLFDDKINSSIIDKHNTYKLKGETAKVTASRMFFEKLGILELLTDTERHSIITTACKNLINVHYEYNNFYNEYPFAMRLDELVNSTAIPSTAQAEFVNTVLTCYVGNSYGTASSAEGYYTNMIKNFSPKEIEIMLKLPEISTVVADRIRSYPRCRQQYYKAVQLLAKESISPSIVRLYEKYIKD